MGDEAEKRLWEEISKLREKAHVLSNHVTECKVVGVELGRLRDKYEIHEKEDQVAHKELAEVKTQVASLVEIERGRTGKLIAIVGAVTGVVTLIVMVCFKLFERA